MKTKIAYIIMSIAVILAATSCSTAKKLSVKDLSGEWSVVSVTGFSDSIPADQEQPFVAFDAVNGRIFGNAGCNSIMGTFNTGLPEGEIKISDVATTRMMCPNMDFEQALLKALGETTAVYEKPSGEVVLCDAKGNELITLKKRVATFSARNLEGSWNIEEVAGKQVGVGDGEKSVMTFDLSDNTFYCSTPCNSISGSFQSDYIDIRFDNMATTLMACEDMSVEDALNAVLPTVTSFGELADGSIGFYSSSNELVLILGHR